MRRLLTMQSCTCCTNSRCLIQVTVSATQAEKQYTVTHTTCAHTHANVLVAATAVGLLGDILLAGGLIVLVLKVAVCSM